MTVESENLALMKDLYDAWGGDRGDNLKFMGYLSDGVRWRSLSNGAPGMEFTKECNCKGGVSGYIDELLGKWTLNYYRPLEFIAQGDRVIVLAECSWTNKATGRTFETPKADTWRLADGKIVDFFEFYDTARAEWAGSA